MGFHYIHKFYMCSIKMFIIFIEKSMYIFYVTIIGEQKNEEPDNSDSSMIRFN